MELSPRQRVADLRKRAAQFHRKRPQPIPAAPTVTGAPRLFQYHGSGAHTFSAHGLSCALELVGGGGNRREIAQARCYTDLALGIDRGIAKFFQQ